MVTQIARVHNDTEAGSAFRAHARNTYTSRGNKVGCCGGVVARWVVHTCGCVEYFIRQSYVMFKGDFSIILCIVGPPPTCKSVSIDFVASVASWADGQNTLVYSDGAEVCNCSVHCVARDC